MKPNEEQLLAVKQYLEKHLLYQETKEEVFDHILTALEHTPEDKSFGEAMNAIIKDIGGLKGISLIESTAKKAAIKRLFKSYLQSLQRLVGSAFIIAFFLSTVVIYYFSKFLLLKHYGFVLLIMLIVNIPSFAINRQVVQKQNLHHIKNSAFKTFFTISSMMPSITLLLGFMIYRLVSLNTFEVITPYISTAAFDIAILHSSIIYTLSRNEFKKPTIV